MINSFIPAIPQVADELDSDVAVIRYVHIAPFLPLAQPRQQQLGGQHNVVLHLLYQYDLGNVWKFL